MLTQRVPAPCIDRALRFSFFSRRPHALAAPLARRGRRRRRPENPSVSVSDAAPLARRSRRRGQTLIMVFTSVQ
jgi:hypothetical protein